MRRLLALAAVLLVAGGSQAKAVRSVFAGADPFALAADGALWIYPTGRGDRLDAWSSRDGRRWTRHPPLLRLSQIGWVRADGTREHSLWAPDMLRANGRYYLYYSVGPQRPALSRIGVAVCAGLAGPCRDSGRPLLSGVLSGPDAFEAIDPMAFVDPNGGRRLLYAGGSAGAKLRVFELARDMVTIARELPVEQPPFFTEGVFVHERRGLYYLSWSHGHWDRSDYQVHYATGSSATGPWTYRGVILKSDRRFKGPGHHAFVRDPRSGGWLIVYHRWEGVSGDGPYGGVERRVAIQPITYDAEGLIEPVRMSD